MIKGKQKAVWEKEVWNRLVPIEITSDMVERALAKGCSMGELKNSITKGEGNGSGFLGEEMLKKYYAISSKNTFDYDMMFKDKKLEVKTKRTSVPPEPHYECSVAAYNTRQKCDFYVFARVSYDLTQGWIIGYLSKKEFYEIARYSEEGTYEEENDYVEQATCYKVQAKQTLDIKILEHE
jgi:hypothetical protein